MSRSSVPLILACSAMLFLQATTVKATEGWINLIGVDVSDNWNPKSLEHWQTCGGVAVPAADPNTLTITPGSGLMAALGVTKSRDANVASKQEFGDIELQAEFLIPSGSNSGIYFMGRYEVQIKDSHGKAEIDSHDCGAIYQRWDVSRPKGQQGYEGHIPKSNASRPPGQWQSLHIVFRTPRFDADGKKIADAVFKEVKHNGVVIHSDVSLTGPTRGGLPETESAAGPLLLQGNHGPIVFRKFLVRETTE